MSVKYITSTPNAEEVIGYCARVSNPSNQSNPNIAKLLSYCIKHGHWSVFETASLTLEIETSRAIAAQIIRHKTFCFQEFSQRYSEATDYVPFEARKQDNKNRQNSTDTLSEEDKEWFRKTQEQMWALSYSYYKTALSKGIAKECARALLPLSTKTRLYMTGNIRSWIHYIQLRSSNGTQKEHMDIALQAKEIFKQHYPIISEALGWT